MNKVYMIMRTCRKLTAEIGLSLYQVKIKVLEVVD